MKKRKFALGGSTGGAMGGLDTINQGAGQLQDSLQQIGQGLNGGGGQSPFDGKVPGNIEDIFGKLGQGFGPNVNNFSQPTAAEGMQNLGFKKGGKVSSASKRGDGIATKGKTRGRMC